MSSIDLDQWPQYASANDVGVETRVEMLRRRVAAYRCYLVAGTDINIVRQILREIAIDEAELAVLLKEEPGKSPQQADPSFTKDRKP
jgi:hypothetical protein